MNLLNTGEMDASLKNYLEQLNEVDKNLVNLLEKRKIIKKMIKRIKKKRNIELNYLDESKIKELSNLTKKYKTNQIEDIFKVISSFN